MCGICGFIDLHGEPSQPEVASQMITLLKHRGPEGTGSITKHGENRPTVFLGHTRLRVIDLSENGDQPMPNQNSTIWVSLNGEIYNYRELRLDLELKGYKFRSQSDTEVLVHAYEQFGDGVVNYLDGMFAFSIWDENKEKLLLARDRSGKKPLYYNFNNRYLTFGSEIKTLLACPWVTQQIAFQNIPDLLLHGFVPWPETMYEGILQVPPGSFMVFDKDGIHEPENYWTPTFGAPLDAVDSFKQAQEKTYHLLNKAVAKRLVSDAPLGALLSGGLDSAIIVALASQSLDTPLKTFTVGFNEADFDERSAAKMTVEMYGTSHTEISVDSNVEKLIETILWHHDQPYGDESAIPSYLVSQAAKEHVTVVLNGDGGDESFAGYNRFAGSLYQLPIPKLLNWVPSALSKIYPSNTKFQNLKKFMENSSYDAWQRYLNFSSIFSVHEIEELVSKELRAYSSEESLFTSETEARKRAARNSPLHEIMQAHYETVLPDALLVKADRMSMAVGLEARSPFLDTALVEYVATLPESYKLKGRKTKILLRETFKDLLPSKLMQMPKKGFDPPIDKWFRNELSSIIQDTLLAQDSRASQFLSSQKITQLYRDHQRGKPMGRKLWVLMNLELWLRAIESNSFASMPLQESQVHPNA